MVASTATSCVQNWPGLPWNRPSAPAPLIAFQAKRPVASAPQVPPTPCTPTTSSESSYPSRAFRWQPAKQSIPATPPMISAASGPTNPQAGVIATRPATAPEAVPSAVGFPRSFHSATIQPSAAAAAPVLVARNALAASPEASSALPALNPNQPNQSSPAPINVSGRLCGGIGVWGYPFRLPIISAQTSAEVPDERCTTVPPAKSSAPSLRRKPPSPQTQCASGS